tara:strand:- start:18 stop:362 length:345 start_codon:yes stop_codon:yes gene_type:complete
MRMSFTRKDEDPSQLSAYVKSLNRQIEDATKMKKLVESEGWGLVQSLWKEYEERSQIAFMSGEIGADEHKAQLKSVRILVGGVEAIAGKTSMDSDPKVRLRELETAKPSVFRRY